MKSGPASFTQLCRSADFARLSEFERVAVQIIFQIHGLESARELFSTYLAALPAGTPGQKSLL